MVKLDASSIDKYLPGLSNTLALSISEVPDVSKISDVHSWIDGSFSERWGVGGIGIYTVINYFAEASLVSRPLIFNFSNFMEEGDHNTTEMLAGYCAVIIAAFAPLYPPSSSLHITPF